LDLQNDRCPAHFALEQSSCTCIFGHGQGSDCGSAGHDRDVARVKGENPFKTRAYHNAARALESLAEPLDKLVGENRLADIKGIGESIQKKITELATTGKLAYYEELKAATPPGLVAMLEVPGLGPKKIKVLHDELGIASLEQLEAGCKSGRVAALKGLARKRKRTFSRVSNAGAPMPRAT